jgi:hypothetical protein
MVMVGHYGVKEGVDPLPRLDTDHLLDNISETICDIETEHDAAGTEIHNLEPHKLMLETQMVSLCLRVNKLLGKE